MKSNIVYSKQQERLFHQLETIHEYSNYDDYTQPNELSFEIILEKCALAWAIERSALIGKINHNKYDEKVMKSSFLFGCRIFSNKDSDDVYAFVGYGKNLSYYKGRTDVLTHLTHRLHLSDKILTFIQSLIDLAPKKFKQLVEASEKKKKEVECKESQASNGLPTMKDYVELLEQHNNFLRGQITRDLDETRRNLEIAKKEVLTDNRFTPIWQSGKPSPPRIFNKDIEIELWKKVKATDHSWIVQGFEGDMKLFYDNHRN